MKQPSDVFRFRLFSFFGFGYTTPAFHPLRLSAPCQGTIAGDEAVRSPRPLVSGNSIPPPADPDPLPLDPRCCRIESMARALLPSLPTRAPRASRKVAPVSDLTCLMASGDAKGSFSC